MKARLRITYKDSIKELDISNNTIDNIKPEVIWNNIVNNIKTFKKNNVFELITYIDLVHSLLMQNYKPANYNDNIDILYYLYLEYTDTILLFKAYHNGNKDQGIICYENRYVIDHKNEGNCIDDFIKRGINPQIENIQDLINSINKRLPERQVTTEYHRTYCYERDFAEISLIKKFAQKIVENCDKHLERISEFYTR